METTRSSAGPPSLPLTCGCFIRTSPAAPLFVTHREVGSLGPDAGGWRMDTCRPAPVLPDHTGCAATTGDALGRDDDAQACRTDTSVISHSWGDPTTGASTRAPRRRGGGRRRVDLGEQLHREPRDEAIAQTEDEVRDGLAVGR